MTILEKIAKIKEDTQKVYDAGYDKGYEQGKMRVAKVENNGTIYPIPFVQGMTWQDFVDGEYNQTNYGRGSEYYQIINNQIDWCGFCYIVDDMYTPVDPTSKISTAIKYYMESY